jgi:hypothetical protein
VPYFLHLPFSHVCPSDFFGASVARDDYFAYVRYASEDPEDPPASFVSNSMIHMLCVGKLESLRVVLDPFVLFRLGIEIWRDGSG